MNTFENVHSKRVRYEFFAHRPPFLASVDYRGVSGADKTDDLSYSNRPEARLGDPSHLTHPQYLESLIHEKLSKVNDSSRTEAGMEEERLQGNQNEWLTSAIKQLDKHTLNMYTLLRAELGTRELSWIRLELKELLANANGKGFRRNGSNE
jgi:hypothetical protein